MMTLKPLGQETQLREVLETIPDHARRLGLNEFEAFAYSKSSRCLMIDTNRINSATVVESTGLSIRVVRDARAGASFCSSFRSKDIEKCMRSAKALTASNQPDLDWPGFPCSKGKYPEVKGLFDSGLISLELNGLKDMAETMIEGARSVAEPISVTLGGVECSIQSTGVLNSSGIEAHRRETALQAFCVSLWGSGSSVTAESAQGSMSRSTNMDFEKIGRDSAEIALKSSVIAGSHTGECDVVFSPAALGDSDSGLLNIMMQKSLSGQSVIRKNSFLSELLGEQIAPKELTIYDNPVLSGAGGSKQFDDEGMPTKKKTLIKEGVVNGFVWDNYYGAKAHRSSTGNAVRNQLTGAVSSSPLNLQIRPGSGMLEDLVAEVDDGYLVWSGQGVHTSNLETGDFSFVANPGLKIRKGQIVGGARGVMISGNLLELIKGISRIGADITDYGNNLMPSIRFSNVKVTTG
ncbi:MAG: TldD/PmbA family protein [Candidatus Thermoplasmatota archaeon]|nr:TldD/PmbA family protein [Candidatus Thermoplasmatota archaeon]